MDPDPNFCKHSHLKSCASDDYEDEAESDEEEEENWVASNFYFDFFKGF